MNRLEFCSSICAILSLFLGDFLRLLVSLKVPKRNGLGIL
jgi:hypothetical protein